VGSFVIVAVIGGIIGIVGISGMKTIDTADTRLFEKAAVPLGQLASLLDSFQQLRINLRKMGGTTDESVVALLKADCDIQQKNISKQMSLYSEAFLNAQDQANFREFDTSYSKYLGFSDSIIRLVQQKKNAEALVIINGEAGNLSTEIRIGLQKIVQFNVDAAKSISDANTATANSFTLTLVIIIAVGMILSVILGLFIATSIAKPLNLGVDFAKGIAEGDLTRQIDIKRKDEVGILADALNLASSNLRMMFKDVNEGIQTLSSSATELSAISKQMTSGAESTSLRANGVAAAAEQTSANMGGVSAAMEETTVNLSTVATASEEMTSTIGEIAANSERARKVTAEAVDSAKRVSETMDVLGKAAKEIGKVTETISAISSQTNLLALNATIEAARAGAAGKGFAVVANEIKELARQTATATEDIKTRIEGIQSSSGAAASDIGSVTEVIRQVNEIVSGIAAAIEEQSAVTKDIANNVSQASKGVDEANRNVAEASKAVKSMAEDVTEVNQAAGEMSSSSSQVLLSAGDLSKLSEVLRTRVELFKI
ncbi:MAG: methyl-accepting chemotaxis protein, partial [Spirochaetota bacterium]